MTDFKNREGLSKVRPYGSNFVNSQDKCAYLLITMTELKRPRVEDYDMTTQHEQFFAAEIMEKNKIFSLVVNSPKNNEASAGIITMHQLLEAGII